MGIKYPGNSIVAYNQAPPSDDGTVVETNKVKYATTKTKLADPVKTLAEAMETDLVAHFDRGPVAATSNATLGAANFNEIIEATGTHTQTLSDAATLGKGWFCDIINAGTGIITLGRDTAGDTIDGATANATIPSLKSLRVFVNAAETGFITHNTNPLTTRGDLMYVDSSGDVNRLAVGGANTFFGGDGTDMAHRAIATADIAAGVITLAKLPTGGKLELQTAIATTSGTEWDYTGISADVKKITLMFTGFSTNGNAEVIVQLGDSGGFEATGYVGALSKLSTSATSFNHSTGFLVTETHGDASVWHGAVVLTLLDASNFIWSIHGGLAKSDSALTTITRGTKALSAALTQIRVTTISGSDTGDAGSINILVE